MHERGEERGVEGEEKRKREGKKRWGGEEEEKVKEGGR